MPDPRQNVRPGERVRIAAAQINALNAMMRQDMSFRGEPLAGNEPGRNVILARNDSTGDVPRWGVLEITGIEIDPEDGDTERRSFEELPVVTGDTPSTSTAGKLLIAVEPIKAGKIGRVAVAGVVQVKVNMVESGHTHAAPKSSTAELESAPSGPVEILWSGGTTGTVWALVRFGGGGGGVRVGKTTATWSKGTLATIDLYEEGDPPNETQSGELTDCVNKFSDIAADRWVAVGMAANGRYYVIAAEC